MPGWAAAMWSIKVVPETESDAEDEAAFAADDLLGAVNALVGG